MKTVLAVLAAVAVSLVARQLWEVLPWVSKRIIAFAVWVAPRGQRARIRRECLAELDHIPGGLLQIAWAFSPLLFAASERAHLIVRIVSGTERSSIARRGGGQQIAALEGVHVTVTGDVEAVLRLGFARTRAELEEFSSLIARGVLQDRASVVWEADAQTAICEISEETTMIRLRFDRTDEGSFAATLEHYWVLQTAVVPGRTKAFIQGLVTIFDRAEVSWFAAITDTRSLAGKTWAYLGGSPGDEGMFRRSIADAIMAAERTGLMDTLSRDDLAHLATEAPLHRLAYDLSRSVTHDGKPVGWLALQNVEWEPTWDLLNREQRELLWRGSGGPLAN